MRNADVLRFHVEIETVVAAIAADSARLHATERRRQVAIVLGVDPDHARLERAREAMRAPDVVRPEIRGEAIAHAVCDRKRLALVGEWYDGQHRSEDLLLRHSKVVLRAREHGW